MPLPPKGSEWLVEYCVAWRALLETQEKVLEAQRALLSAQKKLLVSMEAHAGKTARRRTAT